jgi:hypothetical protein
MTGCEIVWVLGDPRTLPEEIEIRHRSVPRRLPIFPLSGEQITLVWKSRKEHRIASGAEAVLRVT